MCAQPKLIRWRKLQPDVNQQGVVDQMDQALQEWWQLVSTSNKQLTMKRGSKILKAVKIWWRSDEILPESCMVEISLDLVKFFPDFEFLISQIWWIRFWRREPMCHLTYRPPSTAIVTKSNRVKFGPVGLIVWIESSESMDTPN